MSPKIACHRPATDGVSRTRHGMCVRHNVETLVKRKVMVPLKKVMIPPAVKCMPHIPITCTKASYHSKCMKFKQQVNTSRTRAACSYQDTTNQGRHIHACKLSIILSVEEPGSPHRLFAVPSPCCGCCSESVCVPVREVTDVSHYGMSKMWTGCHDDTYTLEHSFLPKIMHKEARPHAGGQSVWAMFRTHGP